ncbi:MAG: MjaI family restriction endonuclease [Thermoplasmataceae archaeon]
MVGEKRDFPKYVTQVINLVNQNAHATRPNVVGQLSDLIQKCPCRNFGEWKNWYISIYPNAIDTATDKIIKKMKDMQYVVKLIDRETVRNWVEDLVIVKTYVGLRFQEAIIKKIAEREGKTYKLATPEEESKGIDGFIGLEPISIKPDTYKTKNMLHEEIKVRIIYYSKQKDGIRIE